jgi:ribosomal protein L11 methyltransferase
MRPFLYFRARVAPGDAAERIVAEAWAAGASGLEEREQDADTILLLVYAPASNVDVVQRALADALEDCGSLEGPHVVPSVDWSERWRLGFEPVVISPRLVVRPAFRSLRPKPGQAVVGVEPGQAFGTGQHASTRGALVLLDRLPERLLRRAQVLDAGTGSGVLALAALRLGAQRALGFDLDAVATQAAAGNAVRNGLASRLLLVTGGVDCVSAHGFDLVLANLLRSELEPILEALLEKLAPDGRAVLSGLLEAERPALESRLGQLGHRVVDVFREADASGCVWLSLLTSPRSGPANRSAAAPA